MFQFDAWWFPDGETHLPTWMREANARVDGRLTYQFHKYHLARSFCRRRQHAVDVGAHVGLWTYWMARDFAAVDAFEPHEQHAACWHSNIPPRDGVRLHTCALGATIQLVCLQDGDGSSSRSYIAEGTTVLMRRLDEFRIPQVSFLKLDCEGYEVFVLEGGRDTIWRCRPVIIVEQKTGCAQRFGRGETEACQWLRAMGARCRANLGGDYIYTWDTETRS